MAQPFDVSALKFTAEAVPVADNVSFSSRNGIAWFSVTSNGTIASLAAPSGYRIAWVDGSGKTLGTVGPMSQTLGFAAVPQSDRIVASVNDHRSGVSSLWVRELARDAASRLTFSAAGESNPVVTPDGSRVFFTSDLRVTEAPIDGSTPPKLVIPASAGVQFPTSISTDGRFLIYTSNENQRETKQDLWILPLTGNAKPYPFLVTPAIENQGTFSPDGKWVAYASDATGTLQVYVRPFPGPGPARAVSTKGGRAPRFSRDGKKIYFVDGDKLMVADFHSDRAAAEPAIVFQLDETIQQFEPMADGRFLMLLYHDADASPPVHVIANWRPPTK